LQATAAAVRPGVTTRALDQVAAAELRRYDARSAPTLTYGFPGTACISINAEAAHGLPGPRTIVPGDVVKIDISAERGGYFADSALTVLVPPFDRRQRQLSDATLAALEAGIAAARAGRRVNAIGRAAEAAAERAGFRMIRALAGHGLGRQLHEDPSVPTYFDPTARYELHTGLVLTVEPHVTSGRGRIYQAADGWTLITRDGAQVANFEHTIVVTADRPIVVTAPG
jgi:methionyl aminopeptidase